MSVTYQNIEMRWIYEFCGCKTIFMIRDLHTKKKDLPVNDIIDNYQKRLIHINRIAILVYINMIFLKEMEQINE